MRYALALLVLWFGMAATADAQPRPCDDRDKTLARAEAPISEGGYEELIMLRWVDPQTGMMRELLINPVEGTLTDVYTLPAKPKEICIRSIGVGVEFIPYDTGDPA